MDIFPEGFFDDSLEFESNLENEIETTFNVSDDDINICQLWTKYRKLKEEYSTLEFENRMADNLCQEYFNHIELIEKQKKEIEHLKDLLNIGEIAFI